MSLPDILAAATPTDSGFRAVIPEEWLQGRTAYGGLTAALCYEAARTIVPGLPPLRSAQVSFVGPASGAVTVTATLERQGKNAAFVTARLSGDKGLCTACTFVFMREMESHIAFTDGDRGDISPPQGHPPMPDGGGRNFLMNFEGDFLDLGAAQKAEVERWFRLKRREGVDPMTELVLLADGLPPAAMAVAREWVPISSVTWILNVLRPPETREGWFYLGAYADHSQAGASSQDMSVWNADGELIARGMQSIAIFG